jgi:hypothetical protein
MAPAEMRVSLRMPEALKKQLDDAAQANGHSFSDEVRQRLMASFELGSPSAFDPRTSEFATAIVVMADELNEYYPPWYADPFSFKTFAAAINRFLYRRYRPSGDLETPEPKPKPGSPAAEEVFRRNATVESMSAMLVGIAIGLVNQVLREQH